MPPKKVRAPRVPRHLHADLRRLAEEHRANKYVAWAGVQWAFQSVGHQSSIDDLREEHRYLTRPARDRSSEFARQPMPQPELAPSLEHRPPPVPEHPPPLAPVPCELDLIKSKFESMNTPVSCLDTDTGDMDDEEQETERTPQKRRRIIVSASVSPSPPPSSLMPASPQPGQDLLLSPASPQPGQDSLLSPASFREAEDFTNMDHCFEHYYYDHD